MNLSRTPSLAIDARAVQTPVRQSKKPPPYLADDQAAKIALLVLETRKPPAKADQRRLDSAWSLFVQKLAEGADCDVALISLESRNAKRAAEIQVAITLAQASPTEANNHEKQTGLDAELAKLPRTDIGNGDRLVARHGYDLRHVQAWDSWAVWDGRRWSTNNDAAALRRAKATALRIANEAVTVNEDKREAHGKWYVTSSSVGRLKGMLALAGCHESISVDGRITEVFDRHPMLLNCLNGTLDLVNGRLREHRRSDLITQLCPFEFPGLDATCPLWESTVSLVLGGDPVMIAFFQKLCGLILTGRVTEQYLPIFYGRGENGKSTILNALLLVLGTDYASKAPSDFLMVSREKRHPTELANLYGKRLIVAIETGEGRRINETLIKELTGSDPITARRMYENFWTFDPTHKVILATNHKPTIKGTDHAIWRRLLLVPFNVTISGPQRDKTVPERLKLELPAILAWCVRGCLAWQQDGELEAPPEVREATAEYRREEDQLTRFLEDRCEIDKAKAEWRVKSSMLYEAYESWCKAAGETSRTLRTFGISVADHGFNKIQNNGIYYEGIKLRHESTGDRSHFT